MGLWTARGPASASHHSAHQGSIALHNARSTQQKATLSLTTMRVQVAFGLVLSADIVLAAYIYQLVPPRDFVAATAVASAASLLGLVLGAESSEILLALGASLTSLFYISLATVSSSAVLTLWLPASSASVARVQSSVRPSSQAH